MKTLLVLWAVAVVAVAAKSKPKVGFYAGRVPPGRFEYDKLNGWMTTKEAVEICERNPACGGFTFKGAYKLDDQNYEIYFFHYVEHEINETTNYYHWSTYRVKTRQHITLNDVKLKGGILAEEIKIKSLEKPFDDLPSDIVALSLEDSQECSSHNDNVAECNEVVPNSVRSFKSIDFSDIEFLPEGSPVAGSVTVMIKLYAKNNAVKHTLPAIDRCCKWDGNPIEFDGFDNIPRISCNISKPDFWKNYIMKREAVMLLGCQDGWRAQSWKMDELIMRYGPERLWNVGFQVPGQEKEEILVLTANQIMELWQRNATLKVFEKIYRHVKGIVPKEEEPSWFVDLMDDYERPKPMPKDLFDVFDVENNQNYVMMSTRDSGTDFHIDPEVTDAYNALIYGKKWWVYLPKDYLDYEENLACDPSCSSPMVNHTTVGGVWNTHILPQIRDRKFYGHKVHSGLQVDGETLFMPHWVHHSVFNVAQTVAIGDNYLYDASMEEMAGGTFDMERLNLVLRHLFENDKLRVRATLDQVQKATAKPKKANKLRRVQKLVPGYRAY